MIVRLVWVETTNGYRSGRYRIERIAPRLWALVVEKASGARILSTATSLSLIRQTAEEAEARRCRRRYLGRHLSMLALAVVALAALPSLPITARLLGSLVAVFVLLRSVVSVFDSVTGAAWAWLDENYQ